MDRSTGRIFIKQKYRKKDTLIKISDDELSEYYYKVVEEQGLWDDARKFIRKWCMDFK